ncbi:hypothetical protein MMC19_001657, partial [Ptychographa xylographoides]|nr:hypothetical protein [Ptychographa xylographoides]
MPSISNTLIASLAGFAALGSAAVLPRAAANGYYWTLSTTAQDPIDFSNNIITACNGKFYIGGVDCHATVVVACGKTTGAQTTCALASEDGLQPIYLASDGSLSYVAPNAGVPSGSNAAVWSTAAQVGYSRTLANSASTAFSQDFVICQTATGGSGQGWQVFSLQ